MALDQGTTSSRAVIFDESVRTLGVGQVEFPQHFPEPGWVEHDPQELWESQQRAINGALKSAGVDAGALSAIGITNQRETVMLWERETGLPTGRAIVWQDRRTAPRMAALRAEPGRAEAVHRATGLVLDPYFSASKIEWMLSEGGAPLRARAERGELCAGTVDSWMVWQLTKGAAHVTDVSNASRTMLMDLHTLAWDDSLLALFRIPKAILPRIVPSGGIAAHTDASVLGAQVPISGILGDQQAALFGQQCVLPGQAKCTYGTGCFLLSNTGHELRHSKNGLLTTVAWQREGERPTYALEGSVFMGGATIQWLRDGLGIISTSPEVNELAGSVPDSAGVTLVPAFAGLGAPHWDAHARGLIGGLTRGATKAHIARAALEGIAFQCAELFDAFGEDGGAPLSSIRVDGGAAASDLLMQIQADLSGVNVDRPRMLESTALGAALMAGISAGVWGSMDQLAAHRGIDRVFQPARDRAWRAAQRARWGRAVERAKGWESPQAH
ncbi:MAG: glycerol kinase GlpK [Planctomycetota bacterium]|nr:glycerol kinase GlpK [Planctomycetota bacterium]MDA1106109.1 glycerol kinase GlpK [Planctomycetota bacterium]